MKQRLSILIAWLIPISIGLAQLSLEVTVEQEQFLRDEGIPIKVKIKNVSGQTVKLGAEPDWLNITVESRDGFPVTKLSEVQVPGSFSIDSATIGTRTLDISPFYDLSRPGRYTITASLRVKQWSEEFTSAPLAFEVVRGTKLWEQEFGIPVESGSPEVRKYTLQQAQYLKHLMLYLRVTDITDNKVFRVAAIGPLVSFSRPEAQIDKMSQLHVLFQTGARSFSYNVISPNGEILLRQTHDYSATRPVLRTGENGRINVVGGIRRLTDRDLPRPGSRDRDVPKP